MREAVAKFATPERPAAIPASHGIKSVIRDGAAPVTAESRLPI